MNQGNPNVVRTTSPLSSLPARLSKMLSSPWLFLLFCCCSRAASATSLRNVTIDDQDSLISYFPRAAWGKITDNMDAGGTHMVTGQEGSFATLTFSFVSVYFISTLWPYHVAVDFSIDGQVTRLDLQDYTQPVVPWGNRATRSSHIVHYFQGIVQKEHTIRIAVPPGDKIAVVDMFIFEVDDSVSNPPPNPATSVTTATVLVGLTDTAGSSHPTGSPDGDGGNNNNNAPPFTSTDLTGGGRLAPTMSGSPPSSTNADQLGSLSLSKGLGSTPSSASKSVTDTEREKSQQKLPAIIGGVIGGFVVLSLILVLVWLVMRSRKRLSVVANPTRPTYQTTPNYDVDLPGSDNHASYTGSADHHRTPLMAEIRPFTSSTSMANADAYNPQSLYQDGGLGNSVPLPQDGASSPPSRTSTYQDPFSDYSQSYQPYLQQQPQPPPSRPMSIATLGVTASPYTPPQSQPGADPIPIPTQAYDTSLLSFAPSPHSYGDGRQSVPSTPGPAPSWGNQPLKFVPIA